MVIDTSALLAILHDEPERRRYTEAIEAASERWMSVATFVEVSIVIEARYGAEGMRDLDLLVERAGIELVDLDCQQAALARHGFTRFGKGRHPAALSYGDLFSYALARSREQPLLFKGDDFSQTDLVAVLPPTAT